MPVKISKGVHPAGNWAMNASLPVSFLIKNSPGILSIDNSDLLEHGSSGKNARRMIVIDRNICNYYLDDVIKFFKSNAVEYHVVAIDANEEDKEIDQLISLLKEIEFFGLLRRNEPIIAIGGGFYLIW